MAQRPSISVVIAIAEGDAAGGLRQILASLRRQREHWHEIIVVGAAGESSLVEGFPEARWLPVSDALVPMRWARGIEAATGDLVAVTMSQMLPDDQWLATASTAFDQPDCAGAGGPIDPPPRGGAVAWAVFFLRYSDYLAPRTRCFVSDLAADNAAYRRAELLVGRKLQSGFWEQEFHKEMLARGLKLAWVPDMRVSLFAAPGLREFMRQRFAHGTRYGRMRVAEASAVVRVARILSSPFIPAVFIAKITMRVLRGGGHFGRFIHAMPPLVCLLLSWTIGETWGYLTARRDRPRQPLHEMGVTT